jgi:hypothetical protein
MGFYDVWFNQDEYDVAMDSLPDFVSPYGLTARIYAVRYTEVPSSYAVRWFLAEGIPVYPVEKDEIIKETMSAWKMKMIEYPN